MDASEGMFIRPDPLPVWRLPSRTPGAAGSLPEPARKISVRMPGDLYREPHVEASLLGSHLGEAGLELVGDDVGAVLGYDARPD